MMEANKEGDSNNSAPTVPVYGPLTAEERAEQTRDNYGRSFQIGGKPTGELEEFRKITTDSIVGSATVVNNRHSGLPDTFQDLHNHSVRNNGVPESDRTPSHVPHGSEMRDSDKGYRGRRPARTRRR